MATSTSILVFWCIPCASAVSVVVLCIIKMFTLLGNSFEEFDVLNSALVVTVYEVQHTGTLNIDLLYHHTELNILTQDTNCSTYCCRRSCRWGETLSLNCDCGYQQACSFRQVIYECGDPQWNDIDRGNWRNPRKKPDPVQLCPPQIAHGLTRASAVRGRRPTAWAMAPPSIMD
jgi:hypothetical protein